MKCAQLIWLFSVIVVVYSKADSESYEDEEEMKRVTEECRKELNATEDDAKLMENELQLKTRTQFCLCACVYKKIEFMDKDNNLSLEQDLEYFDYLKKEDKVTYKKVVKITKNCHKQYTPVKDECDSVKSYLQCLVKGYQEEGVPLDT